MMATPDDLSGLIQWTVVFDIRKKPIPKGFIPFPKMGPGRKMTKLTHVQQDHPDEDDRRDRPEEREA